ncbi:MAG: hypothetical protein KGY70_18560 [Bacteroidales bacterium]|nr:hypothetical protein [Bacteroidales bacterium]
MIKMRIGFGIKAVLVILISFLAGCEEDKTNLVYELNPPDELGEEVYGVYSRVIDHQFSNQDYLVLQQQTDTTVHEDACQDLYARDTTGLDSLTLDNYIKNNEHSYNLGTDFDTDTQVKLVTHEELESYELDSYEGWESFHKNYPETKGVLYLTFPGFNSDSTRTLLEYTWHTGKNQSEFYIMYLKEEEGKWDIMAHETIDEE